jgi:hypothetical protein
VRRRVWCETLSFDEVAEPRVISALARHRVELLLAVRPWQLDEVADVVERVRGAGVFVGVWPMLADADGRWASVRSVPAFVAFTDALLARVPACDELAIDLEPPIEVLAQWKALRPAISTAIGYRDARDELIGAIRRWQHDRRVTTAILPLLALEWRGQWMQRALGTPATRLPVDAHSVMAYTSLFEGWSRGLVNRRRAELLLSLTARLSRARFGPTTAISLGCVGAGAFGDEPGYRGIDELARDVEIASASGIREIALFDLGACVRRGDLDAWLTALRG